MLDLNFDLKLEPQQMSSLVLAYLGDAVYELYVRSYLIGDGRVKVNQLHRKAVLFVRAKTQARILAALEGTLSEMETDVVRRGRNTKSLNVPKNTEVIEYRYATAFECLIGYLYLKHDHQRIAEIFQKAVEVVEGGTL